jgi:hypothetical protein
MSHDTDPNWLLMSKVCVHCYLSLMSATITEICWPILKCGLAEIWQTTAVNFQRQLGFDNHSCELPTTAGIWQTQLWTANDSWDLTTTAVNCQRQLGFDNYSCEMPTTAGIWQTAAVKCQRQLGFDKHSCELPTTAGIWQSQLWTANGSWDLTTTAVNCQS